MFADMGLIPKFIDRAIGKLRGDTTRGPGRALYPRVYPYGQSASTTVTDGETALTVTEYYNQVKRISETVARMQLLLYRTVYRPGQTRPRRDPVTSHPLLSILRRPNAWTTIFNVIRTAVYHYCTWGNGYIIITTDEVGDPTGLVNRHPAELIPYEHYPAGPTGPCEIWYKDYLAHTAYPSAEVIHLADISDNELLGVSKVARHAYTIGKSKAALQLVNTLFTEGSNIRFAVEYPVDAQVEGSDAIQAMHMHWREVYGGLDKEHVPAVITDGGTIKQIKADMPLGDAQYIEGEALTASQIRDIFGVPARDDYATREEYMDDFHTFAIAPLQQMIIEQLQASILLRDSDDLYLRYDRHSHANMATLASYLSTMVSGSLMSPNEARDIADLPPVPGGDNIMVQANNLISLNNLERYTEAQIVNLLNTANNTDSDE